MKIQITIKVIPQNGHKILKQKTNNDNSFPLLKGVGKITTWSVKKLY